jgi:hypothetical protein
VATSAATEAAAGGVPTDRPPGTPRASFLVARKGWLVVALVAVFLTFGLPRFLNRDDASPDGNAGANFAQLCRDHGGTPATAPAAASQPGRQQVCTVRYGGRVYRMDAITPRGFDEDTARFQRQGCELAQQQRASGRRRGPTFVYHADTGVCERRS